MRYILTILMLCGVAYGQRNLVTISTYPFYIQVKSVVDQKEISYLGVDTVARKMVKRGNMDTAMYYLAKWTIDETELNMAYADVWRWINDDGTVRDWPKLSDALDRVRAIRRKWGIQ